MPSMEQKTTKALVVATKCTSVEQFVATFHRFCDDSTFFVSTLAERPVGLETAFSIQLEDKTPVLRGLCEVIEAWATPLNRFGRPGVRLAVRRLTSESMAVFKMLQDARLAAESAPPPALARTATGRLATEIPAIPPVVARTTTGAKPAGAAIARLPLARLSQATPPPSPRTDPRVSEAPSLPVYDDLSGPIAAPPIPFAPVTMPEPVASPIGTPPLITPPLIPPPVVVPVNVAPLTPPAAPRQAPTPAPSVIVEPALATPEPISETDDRTTPVAVESRTPGSSLVLPANPLSDLTDQSLGGFVDCALYEETGSFFRAPGYEDSLVDIDDPVAPPPTLAPINAIRQSGPSTVPSMLSPLAFAPPPDRQFAPEATPLPMPAPQRPSPRAYSEPLHAPNAVPYTPAHAEPSSVAPSTPSAAPLDSTASLLAMSAPNKRRWIMIGGAAVLASSLLLVIVVTRGDGGGDEPKPRPVKVASATPGASAKTEPNANPSPSAETSDVTLPAAATPVASAAKIAPAPVAVVPPEETDDPGGPPVVGSGPCRLTVSSTPAGSIVRIDDQVIGPSPISLDGPCKRRKVDVKHPRYALGTKFVNLTPDKPTALEVPLARPTHAITIVTVPPGATVSIAGNRAGTSPTSVKIMGFTNVTLTVEKPGFKPISQKVYSKVDQDRVMLKLVRGK